MIRHRPRWQAGQSRWRHDRPPVAASDWKDVAVMPLKQSITREAQGIIAQLHAPGLADPYPLYTWLRENAPVVYSEWHEAYLVSRFADCERIFRSPEVFTTSEYDTLMEFMPQAIEQQEYRSLFASLLDGNPLPYTPI